MQVQGKTNEKIINNKFHFLIIALIVLISLAATIFIIVFSIYSPKQNDKKSMRAINWWMNDNTVGTIESNYNKSYKSAKLALNEKLYTGHQIYLDEKDKPFIISGGTKIYLIDNGSGLDIPESEKALVRTEGFGVRVKIYKDKQECASKEKQSENYKRLIHNSSELDEFCTAVNGMIIKEPFDIKFKNIFGLGKQIYIPLLALFNEIGGSYDITGINEISFSIRTAAGYKIMTLPLNKVWTDDETGRRFAPVKNFGGELYISLDVLNHKFGYDAGYNERKKLLTVVTDTADIAKHVFYAPKKINLTAGKSVYKESSIEFKVPDSNKFILPKKKK